jgi:hypothetical protein
MKVIYSPNELISAEALVEQFPEEYSSHMLFTSENYVDTSVVDEVMSDILDLIDLGASDLVVLLDNLDTIRYVENIFGGVPFNLDRLTVFLKPSRFQEAIPQQQQQVAEPEPEQQSTTMTGSIALFLANPPLKGFGELLTALDDVDPEGKVPVVVHSAGITGITLTPSFRAELLLSSSSSSTNVSLYGPAGISGIKTHKRATYAPNTASANVGKILQDIMTQHNLSSLDAIYVPPNSVSFITQQVSGIAATVPIIPLSVSKDVDSDKAMTQKVLQLGVTIAKDSQFEDLEVEDGTSQKNSSDSKEQTTNEQIQSQLTSADLFTLSLINAFVKASKNEEVTTDGFKTQLKFLSDADREVLGEAAELSGFADFKAAGAGILSLLGVDKDNKKKVADSLKKYNNTRKQISQKMGYDVYKAITHKDYKAFKEAFDLPTD